MTRARCALVALGWIVTLTREASAVGVAVRVNPPEETGTKIEFAANAVGNGKITYTWDFGDGEKSEESPSSTASHVYEKPGHYPIIVVARDDDGTRSDSFLQTVHRPIPTTPPRVASTIVFHAARRMVCSVNADNDTVSCFSIDSREVLFETAVDARPSSLAVANDGNLWVVCRDGATVAVVDGAGKKLETIELPRASRPVGLVMGADGKRAWATLEALGELAEFDVPGRKLVRRKDVVPWAHGLAVDSSGEGLYVTRFLSNGNSGEVVEVESKTLKSSRRYSLEPDPGPDSEASARGRPNYVGAAVPSPDGFSLWLPSKKDNVFRGGARDGLPLTFETSVRTIVSVVDLKGYEERLERRIDLNNRALGLSAVFSPLGDYVFVGLLGNNGVQIIDAYDGRVVGGQFGLGRAPDGLCFDDEGRLYVNSFLSRSVVILDAVSVLLSLDSALEVLGEVVVSKREKLAPDVLAGKKIFYDASDTRMSRDGYLSCASCHLDGFEDGTVWDFTDRGEGLRNTTSLLGKRGTGQGPLHWTANFDEVQDFEHDIRGAFGGSGFLADEEFTKGSTSETLGDPKAGLSEELDALASYLESLDGVPPSPFRARNGSLTEAGWRGRSVFAKAGCPKCHGGFDFTDSALGKRHDVGTIRETSGHRLGGELDGFDTPSLRGLWRTAPYLHDGSAATLEEVVGSRNDTDLHGRTSALSQDERDDLVTYLLQIDNTALEDEAEPTRESVEGKTREGCAFALGTERSDSATSWLLSLLSLFGLWSRRWLSRVAE